ncbi:MAG TPA: hypothetical protein PK609_00165 [Candidatus Paceibacterota bacterium]|nr:hypothetical protein [Candidatus Paceibacterota bacterium]
MTNPLHLPAPELLLRVALALSFIYPALSALVDPYAWIGYFPGFLITAVGGHELLLLHAWGVFEVLLAVWVLFGKRVFIPSSIMALALVLVVVANPGQFPILFRDLSIALASGALAWMHRPTHA